MKESFPWTKKKYCDVLAEYNLAPRQAAELFGASHRTGCRWAFEEGPPFSVALVIELMKQFELLPEDIAEIGERLKMRKFELTPEEIRRHAGEHQRRGHPQIRGLAMDQRARKLQSSDTRALNVLRARREGTTLQQLAEEQGVSRARIQQLEYRGMQIEKEMASGEPWCDLSVRTLNALINDGCKPEPEAVASYYPSVSRLRGARNMGTRSIAEVQEWLVHHGQRPIPPGPAHSLAPAHGDNGEGIELIRDGGNGEEIEMIKHGDNGEEIEMIIKHGDNGERRSPVRGTLPPLLVIVARYR
jgi:hypothetical protein